ncbi:hypothetical protein, partial [Treponema endosymbiont of Eucomonympha sp.]|uniref:hypothetical protein n=1 Tax=Treponema endosymbiont of Eucomonympha sp. TaxID=1580831 RepID=UPI001EE697CC
GLCWSFHPSFPPNGISCRRLMPARAGVRHSRGRTRGSLLPVFDCLSGQQIFYPFPRLVAYIVPMNAFIFLVHTT